MKSYYVFCLILVLSFFKNSYAQNSPKTSGNVFDNNGVPTFMSFKTNKTAITENQAISLLKNVLNMNNNDELKLNYKPNDKLKYSHKRYTQLYKNIEVEKSFYQVNSKDGIIESINGNYRVIKNLNVNPKLSLNIAFELALKHVNADEYIWEKDGGKSSEFYPEGKLVIVKSNTKYNNYKLAYKYNIYASYPLSRDYIYVDAMDGSIIKSDPIIKNVKSINTKKSSLKIIKNSTNLKNTNNTFGNADTKYSGNKLIVTNYVDGVYILKDYSRGNGIETYNMNNSTSYRNSTEFIDNDNNWTAEEWHNDDNDDAALDAHWGTEMTFDYWYKIHNRNSYDDKGSKLKSYVNYGKNYCNAYWNGSTMTYGDGCARFSALTSLDITAHEIGHAVMAHTAKMDYEKESGAINEGYSDIWAAAIEHYAAPEKSAWIIAEDVDLIEGGLRSMKDPKSNGQPDTYKGINWQKITNYPTKDNDYCGVHRNNGVLNHWFYILSAGKKGTNDNGTAYNVNGISIEKAADISWRALSIYLGAETQYSDMRIFTIKSAQDIYGINSVEAQQTAMAWDAVGVYPLKNQGDVYCTSKGKSAKFEWIQNVKIGDFEKASTNENNGYSDFTNDTIFLNTLFNYNIELTPGFLKTKTNEFWKIWIDYNNDLDFDDENELIFESGNARHNKAKGNFKVLDNKNGCVRLRISMKYNKNQVSACERFSYGEVEDYTVKFTNSVTSVKTPNNISIVSNDKNAKINWDDIDDAKSFDVEYKNATSNNWKILNTISSNIELTNLVENTEYNFKVRTVSNENIKGEYSEISNFTTKKSKVLSLRKNCISVSIYPSPATNFININFKLDKDIKLIQILNTTGMVVMNKEVENNENTIDISSLFPGVYFIKFDDNIIHSKYKFLKQ